MKKTSMVRNHLHYYYPMESDTLESDNHIHTLYRDRGVTSKAIDGHYHELIEEIPTPIPEKKVKPKRTRKKKGLNK